MVKVIAEPAENGKMLAKLVLIVLMLISYINFHLRITKIFVLINIPNIDTIFKKVSENGVGYIMSGFPGDECVSNNGSLYYYDYLGNKNWPEIFKMIIYQKISGIKKLGNIELKFKLNTFAS